jgi:hypothetical protein
MRATILTIFDSFRKISIVHLSEKNGTPKTETLNYSLLHILLSVGSWKTIHSCGPGRRRLIAPMLQCDWSYGSGCRDVWFGSWFHILYLRTAHCSLCSNQLYDCFLFSRQIEHGEWCPPMKMMVLLGWIQCLVVAVDCGVRIVHCSHRKS